MIKTKIKWTPGIKRVVRRTKEGRALFMVARTLSTGQSIVVPDNVNSSHCLLAARYLEVCAVRSSPLWHEARFLQRIIWTGKFSFTPASARTSLANYRKHVLKKLILL